MKGRSILFCVWRRLELRILFPFLGFRKGTAIFGSHVLNIEIADSPYRRMMGLSFRKGLDQKYSTTANAREIFAKYGIDPKKLKF